MEFEKDELNNQNINEEEIEKYYYDEEELLYTLDDDFSYQIKKRGLDYYENNMVKCVYKTGNRYFATVYGSRNEEYNVEIIINDEYDAEYECTCPCDFNCKHEYAVLRAISGLDYEEVELFEFIPETCINVNKIIENIPAEELKKYILSGEKDNRIIFDKEKFSEYFISYLPKESYDYYYNNLYNDIVLNENYIKRTETYIDRAKKYLASNEFEEVFKIIVSIIGVYCNTNKLNFDDYVFDLISKISMLLRITYRKSNEELRNRILEWANILEKENYFNNYYLEDLILNIK